MPWGVENCFGNAAHHRLPIELFRIRRARVARPSGGGGLPVAPSTTITRDCDSRPRWFVVLRVDPDPRRSAQQVRAGAAAGLRTRRASAAAWPSRVNYHAVALLKRPPTRCPGGRRKCREAARPVGEVGHRALPQPCTSLPCGSNSSTGGGLAARPSAASVPTTLLRSASRAGVTHTWFWHRRRRRDRAHDPVVGHVAATMDRLSKTAQRPRRLGSLLHRAARDHDQAGGRRQQRQVFTRVLNDRHASSSGDSSFICHCPAEGKLLWSARLARR